MKINIISDIHADVNKKTREVVYNAPYNFSENHYLRCVKALHDFWFNNKDICQKMEIKYRGLSTYFTETQILHTIDDCEKFIEFFITEANLGFPNLTNENVFSRYTNPLNNLDEIFSYNKINWTHKITDLDIDDLRTWIWKKVYDFDPVKLEPADYLVIAGDLGLDNTYDIILKDIEEKTKGKFKKIIHIAGNHDHWWYGQGFDGRTKPDSVNLDRDYFEYVDGDYVFLGCTLWTPLTDSQVWTVGNPHRGMNDYNYIPHFSPYNSRHQYEIQSTWLRTKLAKYSDKKVIVVTHHQPFKEMESHNWEHGALNPAYVVLDGSLDDINEYGNIKLWCCGHTHTNFDEVLHDVHVVRNPIGYRDNGYGYCPAENCQSTSWYNKIIEV